MTKASNRQSLGLGALPLLVLLGAGCGDVESDVTGVDDEITGGTLVTTTQNANPPFSPVVGFTTFDHDLPDCTATKINQGASRDTYITATHCLAGAVGGATPIQLSNARTFPTNLPVQTIREVYFHPTSLVDPAAAPKGLNASSGSFDVTIFKVDKNTSIPALTSPVFDTATFTASRPVRMIAYGCDDLSTNDGRKQTATTSTTAVTTPFSLRNLHYIPTAGNPSGCAGDSGSPLFNNSGTNINKIVGVASFIDPPNSTTHFVRLSKVRRWLDNPQKLNVFINGETGFLLHHGTVFCAANDATGSSTPVAYGRVCDGELQPVDPQYWRILTAGSSIVFQSTRTDVGGCLAYVPTASATERIQTLACNSADTHQQWTPIVDSQLEVRFRNNFASQCLRGVFSTPNKASTTFSLAACAVADDQQFSFYP